MSIATPTFSPHEDPHKFLALVGGRETFDVPKQAVIFAQDDRAEAVYFIQSGRVKVTVFSEHGKQATVAVLETGQFFGEGCLNNRQTHRVATTAALTPCRITRIEKASMTEALQDQPTFAKFFMDHLLSRNSRIQEDVIDQLFNSSEKRLARLLLLLAQYGKEGGAAIIPVTLTQETLAEMIGTTRSRVSFFMNKFRENGFIHYDREATVVHPSLLNSVLRDIPHIKSADDDL
jgi:CRP/FNR family transcriptional regulator, cyclic AMP receptor protein